MNEDSRGEKRGKTANSGAKTSLHSADEEFNG